MTPEAEAALKEIRPGTFVVHVGPYKFQNIFGVFVVPIISTAWVRGKKVYGTCIQTLS